VHVVFGVETAIRGLKSNRFAPRSRWTTRICLGIVLFLELLTFLPTVIWMSPNHCIGSLVWFPIRYEFISLVIIVVLLFVFLILAAVISIQLMRSMKVEINERIAASRMCYYLVIATIVYVSVRISNKLYLNLILVGPHSPVSHSSPQSPLGRVSRYWQDC